MLKNINEYNDFSLKCQNSIKNVEQTIYVCMGSQCIACGSEDVYDNFLKLSKQENIHVNILKQEHLDFETVKTGCQGLCKKAPLVTIEPMGILYTKVQSSDCLEILNKTIKNGEIIERLLYENKGEVISKKSHIPFYSKQQKEVLSKCGKMDPESINNYIALGGYNSFVKSLFSMTPLEICQEVINSNLRGRGGAGFPTGKKWLDVNAQKSDVKYIICNGDEGNPGAFMDGAIMEGDPHSIIEGMLIASFATGANIGYIYVRAEYPLAIYRLNKAIDDCRNLGILGKNILGSLISFDIYVNQGAGAFVCGEGGALIASIEGQRGIPRVKPPRTTEKGLFQKPTVLNNVETLSSIPLIIKNGSDWYKNIGPSGSPGTKTFSVCGNINLGGMVEVPMGTTINTLIFDICDGVENDKQLKAVQMGGPSGVCMPKEQWDVPIDFDSLAKADGMMGAGGIVAVDNDTCMVELATYFMRFTVAESCGKCTPCREGSKKLLDYLEKILSGNGELKDIETIKFLSNAMTKYSLCGLGKTAANPVISTLKHFYDDYLSYLN